ncbi:hybrid sensor histidine kinase/response regulator [Parasphingopyxis marina]|uniref:histidine kinase n=1 Tax=Parasphingopyxis marina TaxID=2761622 RepID=A0A842HZ49_9SPHN|nr:PAS domain-containing sensor histidine kinase [Parasphingopyxis marina]MBC2778212.1 PAS domain-containing protein [Parasphingopyxis marina]
MVDLSSERNLHSRDPDGSPVAGDMGSRAIIWSLGRDFEMHGEQPGWKLLTGQGPEDYTEHGWINAIHPDDAEPTIEAWQLAEAERRVFTHSHRLRSINSDWQEWALKAVPSFDSEGRVNRWSAMSIYSARREKTERQLKISPGDTILSEAEYATVLDQLGEGVIVTNAEGQITFINEAAVRLHGIRELSVNPDAYSEAYSLFTIDGDPYPPHKLPLSRSVLSGETVIDERWLIRRPDGSEVIAIGTAKPIYDKSGKQIGGSLTIRDDTARHAAEAGLALLNETLESRVEQAMAERQAAEAALRQAQKMEAVGQLTGGIAHDFNNLLTVILGSLQLLDLRLGDIEDEKVTRHLGSIDAAAKKAASLTQRLLAFSRRQPLEPKALDVNLLIADLADMIERTIGENIVFRADPGTGIAPLFVDDHQLENVLLNLAFNSRDAMPDGGELWIRTEPVTIEEGDSAELAPGDYALISAVDTGHGMDEEAKARAFEPFFTTKTVGKGTGLGLSMIYGFAKQSGGDVQIESEPGIGTTVRLYLPVHRAL